MSETSPLTAPRGVTAARIRAWVVAAALLAPLVVCAALSPLREELSPAVACLVLVLVVVGVAATGHRLDGLLAAISSGLWFDFFLTEPYGSFVIDDRGIIAVAVLLVLIGAGVSELSVWGRRQQSRAGARAGYLDGVLAAAELIATHGQPDEVLAAQVSRRIAEVLAVSQCRFVAGATHDPRDAVLEHDGSLVQAGRPVDVDRHGLPTLTETVVPVRRRGAVVGHFVVFSPDGVAHPSVEQRRVAVLLADQMGAALEAEPR